MAQRRLSQVRTAGGHNSFDPDKIDDLVSGRVPEKGAANEVRRHPPRIEAVVVNGKVVVEGGACLDVFPGKVTRQELYVPAL